MSGIKRVEPEIIEGVPVHSNGLGGLLLGNSGLLGQLQDSVNKPEKPTPPEEPEKPIEPEKPATDTTCPPELSEGLIPIYYDEPSGEWKIADKDNTNNMWYEYSTTAKRWANICTVSNTTNTSKNYRTAAVGTVIPIEDMTTMFVWIPRYAYKITSGLNTKATGNIEIEFIDTNNKSGDKTYSTTYPSISNNAMADYVVHPAFNYDGKNLNGIWVAKFEASNANCTTTESTGNVAYTSKPVIVLPNKTAWRNISISNIFTTCLEMSSKYSSTYGISNNTNQIDPHMMKNTEWGAVAYLAQSKYGKNAEIWINNSSSFITGSCGNSVSAGQNAGTTTFNSGNGFEASSSGNITGVYDMSGGTSQYTAAYVDNTHTRPGGSQTTVDTGKALIEGAGKYKDVYKGTTDTRQWIWTNNRDKFGDAFWETSGAYDTGNGAWNTDSSTGPQMAGLFFRRGMSYGAASGAGAFAFNPNTGLANSSYGFRPVLVVSPLL